MTSGKPTEDTTHTERWIREYYRGGWTSVLPLPGRSKRLTDSGLTGHDGRDLGVEESVRMALGHGWSSLALRLPHGVIGLDVDAYLKRGVQKQGAETLAELEDGGPWPDAVPLGGLPKTAISTSRTDGASGIRFFRVPPGITKWKAQAGPDIETIQRSHRYAVVAPSEHEDGGRRYRWLWGSTDDFRERASGWLPSVAELAFLPEPWVEHLRSGGRMTGTPRLTSGLSATQLMDALKALPPGPPCPDVEKETDLLMSAARREHGGAHDAMLAPIARLVVYGMGGCPGAGEALFEAREAYVALPGGEGHPHDFRMMVLGAIDQVVAEGGSTFRCSLTDVEDMSYLEPPEPVTPEEPEPYAVPSGPSGPAAPATTPVMGGEAGSGSAGPTGSINDAGWWAKRPILEHIHTAARARMVSPAAVLGVVICRMLTKVPPLVTLPPIVGSEASLNFWVALVGESGDGKSAAEDVAAECLWIDEVHTLTPGSGEGIAASYVRPGNPRAVPPEPEIVYHHTAALFTVDEVETLTALGARTGTTLWSELRKSWTGKALGYANRARETRLLVAAHSYRLTLVVGMQPGKAGPILEDANAGTPQRYLWLPVTDPTAPEPEPEWPGPRTWAPPIWKTELAEMGLEVAPEIWAEIRQIRRDRKRGGSRMAGHRALTRLKVAAALALLDRRLDVTWDDKPDGEGDSDWTLADQILTSSDQVREDVQKALKAEAAARRRSKATAEGLAEITREDVKYEAAVKRVCKWLRGKVGTEPLTIRELTHASAGRDRDVLPDALGRLVGTGELIEEPTPSGRSQQYRKAEP